MDNDRTTRQAAVWWDSHTPVAAPASDSIGVLRARDADRPDDNAHYSCCCCGSSFTASADAGATCPHCGGGQPW